MRFGLPDKITKAVIGELEKRESVERAVIFGSRARGDYRYNSDIDLAIYCDGKVSGDLRLDLDEAAGVYKIQVIDMNGYVSESLRKAIEEGKELYRRNNSNGSDKY